MFLNTIFRRNSGSPPPGDIKVDLARSWEFDSESPVVTKTPRSVHSKLSGVKRLQSVVVSLEAECPWTREVTSRQLLSHLRDEIRECKDELGKVEKILLPSTQEDPERPAFQAKIALQKEISDILFDAFLLNQVCARDHGFDGSATFDMACSKVESRSKL
jgi:NTP pyrophosphatase (non-canonical NTP hydrolase)